MVRAFVLRKVSDEIGTGSTLSQGDLAEADLSFECYCYAKLIYQLVSLHATNKGHYASTCLFAS